jgi:drug/metabolite transporter (DMT)-like permease
MRFSFSRLDALLLVMTFIWGSNFSIIKSALTELPELGFNALRMVIAALLFVTIIAARQGVGRAAGRIDRADWMRLAWLGILGHCIYQFLFLAGVARTSVANSSLIFGCTPVTVALLSAWVGHERLTWPRAAGALLSLAGVVIVVTQARPGGAARTSSMLGDAMVAGAMLSWAVYTVGSRPILARHTPLAVTGFTLVIGTALYAPFGIPSLVALDWARVSAWAWIGLVYSAVFALVVAYLIWYTAVQRVGSSHTSIFSNVVPLVAVTVAALTLGEPITVRTVAGAAAILSGVALTRLEFGTAAEGPLEG